ALRRTLLSRITPERMEKLADRLYELAERGNVQAIKLILSYTVGKPAETVNPDDLDVEEWQHWKGTSGMMHDLPGMLMCIMPETLRKHGRQFRPEAREDLRQQMCHALKHPEPVLPPVPDLVMSHAARQAMKETLQSPIPPAGVSPWLAHPDRASHAAPP